MENAESHSNRILRGKKLCFDRLHTLPFSSCPLNHLIISIFREPNTHMLYVLCVCVVSAIQHRVFQAYVVSVF